ncbi:MAG: acyl-CoA dehydrogenase family protein, partial [Spirochaetota bacterium]
MGLLGLLIPGKYNGYNFNYRMYALMIKYLASRLPSLAVSMGIYQSPCINALLKYGTETQKTSYLPKLSTGKYISGYALYEDDSPDNFSKLSSIEKTIANPSTSAIGDFENKHYVLKGEKSVINAADTNLFFVFARTSGGLSCFIIEKSMGVELIEKDNNQEERLINYSKILLDDIRVPAYNRLGKEGQGIDIALDILNLSRIQTGILCTELSKHILKKAVLSKPVNDYEEHYQMYKHNTVKISGSVFLMESLLNAVCGIIDRKLDYSMEACAFKLYSTKALELNMKYFGQIENTFEKPLYNKIISEILSDRIAMGDNNRLSKYISYEGLKCKQKEKEEFDKDFKSTNNLINEGFKKFGEIAEKSFSTIVNGFKVFTGQEKEARKTQKVITDFSKLKKDIEQLGSIMGKNTKKLLDISLQSLKNFKEETFELLPNDLVGMTTLNSVSDEIEESRDIVNISINILRQKCILLIKEYGKAEQVSENIKEMLTEIVLYLFALSCAISKTDNITANPEVNDTDLIRPVTEEITSFSSEEKKEMKNYYITLINYFSIELVRLIKEKLESELPNMEEYEDNDEINEIIEDIYKTTKKIFKVNNA